MTVGFAPLAPAVYRDAVRRALEEDIGSGDITTLAIAGRNGRARGTFVAKSPCTIAGLAVALEAFSQLDPGVKADFRFNDGDECAAGVRLGEVCGLARALLSGERTALNFLQHLSGIATLARAFVRASRGAITILDTRKTTPTFRALEKYAVRAGGATNHRMSLADGVLIKDNHIRLAGGISSAVARLRAAVGVPNAGPTRGSRAWDPNAAAALGAPAAPSVDAWDPDATPIVEVEVETLDQVDEALAAGADILLLDNMTTDQIREAVRRSRGRAKTEISGGVTLERIQELAATGADFVSSGALTHSAPAADISFDIEPA